MIREVEAELLMSLDTAKSVRDWLTKHIEQLEELQKQVSEDVAKDG